MGERGWVAERQTGTTGRRPDCGWRLVDPVDEEDLKIRILLIHDPAHSNIGYIRMSWQLAGCSTPAGHVSTAKWTNQTLDIQLADR